MEFKKNQIVELYIDDIGNEGEGIGHIDGYALFLKDAVIGDKVRAKIIKTKKNYGFARVEEVLEASKDRVTPRCPKARQCGGCTKNRRFRKHRRKNGTDPWNGRTILLSK